MWIFAIIQQKAGIIYSKNADVYNCLFESSKTSGSNGGVIYTETYLTVDNCAFYNSYAKYSKWAIYTDTLTLGNKHLIL